MKELNLLESFPKSRQKREEIIRNEENREIAKRFDKEFFDGERVNGYGGYYYDGRWRGVVRKLKEVYNINSKSAVLDIGCAKGFLLYDLQYMIPGIQVAGLDVSSYALNKVMDGYKNYLTRRQLCSQEKTKEFEENARRKILPHLIQGSADNLPWPDKSFDVVLSVNTLHNLKPDNFKKSLEEMSRVCRTNNMFVQVDAYRNEEEKQKMKNWVLTAETIMSVEEWKDFFKDSNYKGDYFWTIF
jgi:ubiquinone/menaquinone biosynthesis C-methylase UbiE